MPFFASRSRTFLIVGHHGENAGVGFAFIASASPAVQRGFERIILRGTPVGAKEDKPGKMFCQSHHAQGRLYREYLLFEGEAGPRDPFLLSGRRALIDTRSAAARQRRMMLRTSDESPASVAAVSKEVPGHPPRSRPAAARLRRAPA